jgi:carbamoyl-phosphate synthase large subunit
MNILVTGIAGDIGNGIGRILRDSGLAAKLIGCDIHEQHTGCFVFDKCFVVPRVDADDYIARMLAVAYDNEIDLIVPTSEPELRFLSRNGIFQQLRGIPLIMANREAMEVGFDKLATAKFLESQGLPFPWTRVVKEQDPRELPCIIKSRFGAGSREVRCVDHAALIQPYRQINPDHIWQEYLGTADEEYTCGVFRSVSEEVRVIVFRRRLSAGFTTYGEVVDNQEIDRLCHALAKAVMLNGSINIQLRMTERGPVVFEINPRFSSTVVFRNLMGFRDVIWAISVRLHGVLPPYEHPPRVGTKFFRKFEEIVL